MIRLNIEHDMPQGSVLDPFIIYINDIIKVCPDECIIKMYAQKNT